MADILVVEDNMEMGTLLCDFLNAEGYTTEHCTDGADAMDMFVSSGAKLVILDIMLPHLCIYRVCSGSKVIKIVRTVSFGIADSLYCLRSV